MTTISNVLRCVNPFYLAECTVALRILEEVAIGWGPNGSKRME